MPIRGTAIDITRYVAKQKNAEYQLLQEKKNSAELKKEINKLKRKLASRIKKEDGEVIDVQYLRDNFLTVIEDELASEDIKEIIEYFKDYTDLEYLYVPTIMAKYDLEEFLVEYNEKHGIIEPLF